MSYLRRYAAIRERDSTPITIYALLDPEGRVRYVGQSNDVEKRAASHWKSRVITSTKYNGAQIHYNPELAAWLRTLDEPPQLQVLAVVPRSCSFATERYFTLDAVEKYGDLVFNKRAGGQHIKRGARND